jgi:hypothetical protein
MKTGRYVFLFVCCCVFWVSWIQGLNVFYVCVYQLHGRPLRGTDAWAKVWQNTINKAPTKQREDYLRLKPVEKKTKDRGSDSSDGGGDPQPKAKAKAKAKPKDGSKSVLVIDEAVQLIASRSGDLAHLNGVLCRNSYSVDATDKMMKVMIAFFDCLEEGTAGIDAKDRQLKVEQRITKNTKWLDAWTASIFQPLIGLNSAEWIEMFERMVPAKGYKGLAAESPQLVLNEVLAVSVLCICALLSPCS